MIYKIKQHKEEMCEDSKGVIRRRENKINIICCHQGSKLIQSTAAKRGLFGY